MSIKNTFYILIQLFVLMGLSSTALSQEECGAIPVAPALVDGASTSMDLLVTNSEEVKSYIAAADAFLDCSFAYRDKVVYKDLSRSAKTAIIEVAEDLLEARNAIGDDFNDEVMAYREANP